MAAGEHLLIFHAEKRGGWLWKELEIGLPHNRLLEPPFE